MKLLSILLFLTTLICVAAQSLPYLQYTQYVRDQGVVELTVYCNNYASGFYLTLCNDDLLSFSDVEVANVQCPISSPLNYRIPLPNVGNIEVLNVGICAYNLNGYYLFGWGPVYIYPASVTAPSPTQQTTEAPKTTASGQVTATQSTKAPQPSLVIVVPPPNTPPKNSGPIARGSVSSIFIASLALFVVMLSSL